MKHYGPMLRKALKKHKMTQTELARIAGMRQPNISKLVHSRKPPGPLVRARLKNILGDAMKWSEVCNDSDTQSPCSDSAVVSDTKESLPLPSESCQSPSEDCCPSTDAPSPLDG